MGGQRGPTPDIYKDEFTEQTLSARRAEAPDLSARPAPSLPRGPGEAPPTPAVTPTSDHERPFLGARCVCPPVPLPPRPGEDAGSPCGAQTSGSRSAGRRLCDLVPGATSLCLRSRSGQVKGRFLGSPQPRGAGRSAGPGAPAPPASGSPPPGRPPPPRAAPYLGLEAENQQVQQPAGDKSGRERRGVSAGRARGRRGRGGGTHRQLSAERGLPMARGPERGEPGGMTPARGRTSRERRRARAARGRGPGGDADAAPRVPGKVELAAPSRSAPLREPVAAGDSGARAGGG